MPLSPRLLRPRAAASTAFDPRSIANLAAWYNASDTASLTLETGVRQWSDLSGNGRHLAQTTLNNQPAVATSAINSRPALDFDGSNDSLSATFTLSQPVRIFCVGNLRAAGSQTQLFDGTANNTMRLYVNTATEVAMFASGNLPATVASVTGWFVWECVFNGASSSLIRNGTTLASGNAGSSVPGGLRLAVLGGGTSNFTNCQIAEVVLYSRAITASEASSVRSYLGGKYAITVA